MRIFRSLSLLLTTIAVLGMLNYIILDKLSYVYLMIVVGIVTIIYTFCTELCLGYLKAKEIKLKEDEELVNLKKSLAFTHSQKIPRIYSFTASNNSMLILNSAKGWSILLSENVLAKASFEQKKAIIQTAIKIKQKDSSYLKTFGLSLKVILLWGTEYISSKSELLKKIMFIFLRPTFIYINILSLNKLKINIDRVLLEFKKDSVVELNIFEKVFLKDSNYDLLKNYNLFEAMDVKYE